jgi:thymidylate kinase
MTPLLIAIEGVDGTGKTTLARALAAALNARIIKRPIPGSPAAELIKAHRDDPSQASFLLSALDDDCAAALEAARAYQAQGHAVILDRHYLSTAVYQGGEDWLSMYCKDVQRWGEPDVWIICDAPAGEIKDRISSRDTDQDARTRRAALAVRKSKFLNAPISKGIEFWSIGDTPETFRTVLSCTWTKEATGRADGLPAAAEWIVNRLAQL